MEILQAYCVELDEIVDIYEAQCAYFDNPPSSRKRFTFHCSDEECRRLKNPLVSGVNYHRLAEETEKYRQPHFRAPKANAHLETCIWSEEKNGLSLAEPTTDESQQRVARAKKTNVVDIFRPAEYDTLSGSPEERNSDTSILTPVATTTDQATQRERNRIRDGYGSTSRLERFIDCWLQFDADQLKVHQVAISGKTLSYRQAVTNPAWITEEQNGHRILYGAARISLWPPAKPTRLYLNFLDDCEQFPAHLGNQSLDIDLPLARINQHRGGAVMLHKLTQAQQPDYYLKVYCWGMIKAKDKRPGYRIEIVSLNNLVLKPVAKKNSTARPSLTDSTQ